MACARGLQILDYEGPETETEVYGMVDYTTQQALSVSLPLPEYLSCKGCRSLGPF